MQEAIAGKSSSRPGIGRRFLAVLWRMWDPPENSASLVDESESADTAWGGLGFTLIELLIAMAVIGALAGIAIPNYRAYVEQAEYTTVLGDLKAIEKDILLFAYQNNAYPSTLADVNRQNMRDIWGNPYMYLDVTTAAKSDPVRKNHADHPITDDFDLYSMGPDGKTNPTLTSKSGNDDIIRADNGTFFGRVTDYY